MRKASWDVVLVSDKEFVITEVQIHSPGRGAELSVIPLSYPVVNLIKYLTIVIYDSRVVLTRNCPYYDSRVVIYDRKMFIRLATGAPSIQLIKNDVCSSYVARNRRSSLP